MKSQLVDIKKITAVMASQTIPGENLFSYNLFYILLIRMLHIFFMINWQEVAKQHPTSAFSTGNFHADVVNSVSGILYHKSYITFTPAASREICQQLKILLFFGGFFLFFMSLLYFQSKLYQHILNKAF